MNFQDLLLSNNFSAIAALTPVLGANTFPMPLALHTHRLDLLHHSWPNLVNSDLHACSPAIRAAFYCTFLTTTT